MPTQRATILTTWTDLGPGPLTAFQNQNRVWFDTGDAAPTDDRSGVLHTAQGQARPISFAKTDRVWARAHEGPTDVIVVSGPLASSPEKSSAIIVATYADLPDPSEQDVGQIAIVTADPVDGLNGVHAALGAAPGDKATFWAAAS